VRVILELSIFGEVHFNNTRFYREGPGKELESV
jgi:hypothetical protein